MKKQGPLLGINPLTEAELGEFRPRPYGGPGAPWEPECVGIQSLVLDAADQQSYDERMGIRAKHYLTIVRPEDAHWILEKLDTRLDGKTVVEIGAGIGVLACALATRAKHVYAIEADPAWGLIFARYLYADKPTNLTWILDRAENLHGVIHGDIAIAVTGSDEDNLRQIAEGFAPEVILPWQDWNDGKARVLWGGPLGTLLGETAKMPR